MDLIMTEYIEINSIAIIILSIMAFFRIHVHKDAKKDENKFFVGMLFTNIIILVTDIFIYVLRGHSFAAAVIINHIICVIFYIMHALLGYLWFLYSVKILYPDFKLSRIQNLLLALPVIINTIMAVLSPWTGFFYTISNENVYARGKYMIVTVLFSFIYWILSAALALKEMINPKIIREQSVYTGLLFFPLPTIVGMVLQLVFYGLSITFICTAISLLVLFFNTQNKQLSRDMLTGLFNRSQTDKQLTTELKHLQTANYMLFAMMIDLDHFKVINDTYGHLTGDKALIEVSRILKSACREKDFVSRFGGDEFFVIGHIKNINELNALKANIENQTNLYNSQSESFKISLSIGISVFDKNNIPTIDMLLSSADGKMYSVKKEKKANRK